MTTVALVGADGAGKSTIARRLVESLPVPAVRIYMGVNLESSNTMLPVTRLALAWKRRRGDRTDMTARFEASQGRRRTARSLGRLALWLAEEWYRQAIAWVEERRGRLVVFDRHFYCDYFAADVAPRPGRPIASRLHGAALRRYPRPDLTIVLDAPGEVLFARKREGDPDAVERRRQEYLALGPYLPRMAVVDASRPIDAIVPELVSLVMPLVEASGSKARVSTGGMVR